MKNRVQWLKMLGGGEYTLTIDEVRDQLTVVSAGETSGGRPVSWCAKYRGEYLTATLRGKQQLRTWRTLKEAQRGALTFFAGALQRQLGDTVNLIADLRRRRRPKFAALVAGEDGDFTATCLRTGCEADGGSDPSGPCDALSLLVSTMHDQGAAEGLGLDGVEE